MSGPMAFYDENTVVPLTAEALEMLRRQDVGGDGLGGDDDGDGDDDRDYGYARMLDHGMWNTTGAGLEMSSSPHDRDRVFKSLGGDAGDDAMMLAGIVGQQHQQDGDDDTAQNDDDGQGTDAGQTAAPDDDDDDAYDQVGGSFIAYIAAKYGPPSASRAAQFAMRTIASELDCSRVHAVADARGFVAHESSGVQSHSVPDSCTVMFVGHLENRASLVESCDLPSNATCAELVYKLYNDCGTSFVNQLDGFFAFVLVDADTSTIFAAVDRHGSIPLYKGRSKGGGVFIAHAARSSGTRLVRTLGEMNKIPAGSYVHGNRHIIPHKYARCAHSERVLQEMERHASQQSLHGWQLGGAAGGDDDTGSVLSMLSAGGGSTRSLLGLGAGGGSGIFSTFGSFDAGAGADHVAAAAIEREAADAAAAAAAGAGDDNNKRDGVGRGGGGGGGKGSSNSGGSAARDIWRRDSAKDMHAMQGWNSMTRSWSSAHISSHRSSFINTGESSMDDDDDADETMNEPESRMGRMFRTQSFCEQGAGVTATLGRSGSLPYGQPPVQASFFSSSSSSSSSMASQQQQQQHVNNQHSAVAAGLASGHHGHTRFSSNAGGGGASPPDAPVDIHRGAAEERATRTRALSPLDQQQQRTEEVSLPFPDDDGVSHRNGENGSAPRVDAVDDEKSASRDKTPSTPRSSGAPAPPSGGAPANVFSGSSGVDKAAALTMMNGVRRVYSDGYLKQLLSSSSNASRSAQFGAGSLKTRGGDFRHHRQGRRSHKVGGKFAALAAAAAATADDNDNDQYGCDDDDNGTCVVGDDGSWRRSRGMQDTSLMSAEDGAWMIPGGGESKMMPRPASTGSLLFDSCDSFTETTCYVSLALHA